MADPSTCMHEFIHDEFLTAEGSRDDEEWVAVQCTRPVAHDGQHQAEGHGYGLVNGQITPVLFAVQWKDAHR